MGSGERLWSAGGKGKREPGCRWGRGGVYVEEIERGHGMSIAIFRWTKGSRLSLQRSEPENRFKDLP